MVTEEYPLFGIDSYFADVGGYLGLLLGASILNMVELFSVFVSKYLTK